MRILIQDLTFEAILGILDFERKTPQCVIANCTIDYTYNDSKQYIDYAFVSKLIEQTMKNEKFYLIEDAIETLFTKLNEKFPAIEKLQLTICKPDILPNCRICVSDSRTFV